MNASGMELPKETQDRIVKVIGMLFNAKVLVYGPERLFHLALFQGIFFEIETSRSAKKGTQRGCRRV